MMCHASRSFHTQAIVLQYSPCGNFRCLSASVHALQAGPVIDAGGIFDYARKTGMIKTA
jgi:hypothetical protein